jgi:acyl carrier protein
MDARDDLLRTIGAGRLPGAVDDDTSLVRSGLLDSHALFRMVLWVEEQTGQPLDPTTMSIADELDTVEGVLRFVEARRRAAAASG